MSLTDFPKTNELRAEIVIGQNCFMIICSMVSNNALVRWDHQTGHHPMTRFVLEREQCALQLDRRQQVEFEIRGFQTLQVII